jgi:hypothetical protein
MSRPLVILNTKANRQTAANWCMNAPEGTQVEFRERLRTDDQNKKMWASLTDLARQRPFHNGVKMSPDTYKAMLMHALGHETRFIPTLDGDGVFPLGFRSSRLTIAEMSDLLELLHAFAAREGLTLSKQTEAAA